MKIDKNYGQSLAYIGVCILTFGVACAIRIVITQAIKMAMRDIEQ